MLIFELVIALLLVGVVLSLCADRLDVPYPALLALGGAGLALVPGTPNIKLDPELALALFVAPTLLDAAYDASPRDLRDNFWPVTSLALVAVALTIAAVAFAARAMVPDMNWPTAIALGAIVAPPDASAATAVLRRLRPPHRLMVILEGESLFNDASALLIYRIAVVAAVTGSFSGWAVAPTLLLTAGGGVLVGMVLARVYLRIPIHSGDMAIAVLMQFLSTFAVWLIADALGLSAIITMVAYAMTLARYAPAMIGGRRRIASYAVWEVVVFVLNVLAFVLIGLQLRDILARMQSSDARLYAWFATAICATVIIARVAWVMSYNSVVRWKIRHFGSNTPRPMMVPTVGTGMLISWCGMRGIVTLAAALALPDGSPKFPYRDLIVLAAFCVVLSTLVLQGLTLRPLMQVLGLKDDGSVEREINVARVETARAALQALEKQEPHPAVDLLRREYEARLRANSVDAASASDVAHNLPKLAELQRQMAAAQRQALVELRARYVIGDDAFHAAEEEIDLLELSADARIHPEFGLEDSAKVLPPR